MKIHYIYVYISLEEMTLDSKTCVENETKQSLEATLDASMWITPKKALFRETEGT